MAKSSLAVWHIHPEFSLILEMLDAIGKAAWIEAHKEPEVIVNCDRCEGSGYVVDSYTFQSDTRSSCAGTGIKDYAKTLPSASLREEPAEI